MEKSTLRPIREVRPQQTLHRRRQSSRCGNHSPAADPPTAAPRSSIRPGTWAGTPHGQGVVWTSESWGCQGLREGPSRCQGSSAGAPPPQVLTVNGRGKSLPAPCGERGKAATLWNVPEHLSFVTGLMSGDTDLPSLAWGLAEPRQLEKGRTSSPELPWCRSSHKFDAKSCCSAASRTRGVTSAS